MVLKHNEQSVHGRSQTDYMWMGYQVLSRCSRCGTPLRVRQPPQKLRKGSILRSLWVSMVCHLLLGTLTNVQRWFGTCDKPAYLRDSETQDGIPPGFEATESDGEKASAITRLFLLLAAALVIGRITSRAISRKRRNTETGSSMSAVSRLGRTFLALSRYRNRGKRASQRSYSISLATNPGVDNGMHKSLE
jgi:hypothetical protein